MSINVKKQYNVKGKRSFKNETIDAYLRQRIKHACLYTGFTILS